MANRFQKVIPGSSYIPHNYDAMFKVGLLKDQEIQGIVDSGQDFLNTEGNYSTIYNPDTEYKLSKVNSLVKGMNELASKDLSDPTVQNKLRGLRSGFSNDPEVYGAVQRTNAYNTFLARKKELGDKYRDQNADQFLADIEAYQMGDKDAGERLKLAPDVEGYFDYNKELQDNLANIEANGISLIGGNYINNIEGRFGMRDGEIVTDDRLGKLFLNGLSSEAYQQMYKDYNYLKRRGGTEVSFEDWVGNKAKSFQETYSNTKQKYDYTGAQLQRDKFNYVKQKDAESTQQGIPLNVPGVAQELTSDNFKEMLHEKYGVTGKATNVFVPYVPGVSEKLSLNNDPKYNEMITDLSNKIIKSFDNYTPSQWGLSKDDILSKKGLKIQNGKLIGSPENIENYYLEAFQNANTNALDAYTLSGIFDTENTAKQLTALAQSGRLQLGINGQPPSDAKAALAELISDVNSDKGVLTVINPTSIYGKPTFEVVIRGADNKPGKTYNIGLDQNTMQYFTGVTNLTNSLLQGDTDVDIPVDRKVNPNNPNEFYDLVGVNTREIDENGNTYIGTTLYLKDPKTGEKAPYQYDYKTWMQFEKIPEFTNSPFNNAYKKQVPVRPYQQLLNLN